jgi:hypothetical protein
MFDVNPHSKHPTVEVPTDVEVHDMKRIYDNDDDDEYILACPVCKTNDYLGNV